MLRIRLHVKNNNGVCTMITDTQKNYVCLRTAGSWVMFLNVVRRYSVVFTIKKKGPEENR